jgi:glutamate-1-semialdehyde aminotransferase
MDQAFNKVFVSSTFFGNSLDQIAAIETINFLKKNKVYKNIKNKGLVFIDQISKSLKKLKIECKLSGSAWFPQFTFENKNAEINLKASNIFYSNLIEKGIFMSPYHHSYFMHSHSKKDLIRVIEIIKNSIDLINKKI